MPRGIPGTGPRARTKRKPIGVHKANGHEKLFSRRQLNEVVDRKVAAALTAANADRECEAILAGSE